MNKKVLAVAVSSAMAAPMAAHAVKYKLSGQVNRAIVFNDDGIATDVQFVDNISSGTRWRMTGSEDIGNGLKVGFNWEWQASANPGNGGAAIKSGDYGAVRGFNPDLRKAEVWFSGKWGKVSLGKGDGAGNGTTEVDLSDTWNVAYVGRSSFGNATAWRTGGGGDVTSGGGTVAHGTGGGANALTHGATFSHWDAFSRNNRIRYDSPSIGPVTFAASIGQNELWEVAGRASTGLFGGQLSAGLFYGQNNANERIGGSFSYLFSQGTNVTFSAGSNKPKTKVAGQSDAFNWWVKLGHKWGNNAISGGYGQSKDAIVDMTNGNGYEDSGWNIGYNYNIPKAKVDVYAGYHSNELKSPAGAPAVKDITAFVVGTKLKFD